MPKLLFLSRRDDRKQFDTAQLMAEKIREIQTSDVQYDGWSLEDLLFSYDGTDLTVYHAQTKQPVTDFDGIFLLGWFKEKIQQDTAVAISKFAQAKGITILNTEALKSRSYSKLSQQVMAVIHGVQTTPFIFSMDNANLHDNLGIFKNKYPLVVKSVTASRGNNNFLVKSRQEFDEVVAVESELFGYIVQTFVPNDGDYRLIVTGEKVAFVIHRRSHTGSHLNNTSQGATAQEIDPATLDAEMLRQAIIVSKMTNREVTGVDMIVHRDTGAFYFLEVNNMPQLATGSLVPQKMRALDAFFAQTLAPKGS